MLYRTTSRPMQAWLNRPARFLLALLLLILIHPLSAAELKIAYLSQQKIVPPTLSNLDPVPEDQGIQGARLGLTDNTTTGRFTGQQFSLEETLVAAGQDPVPAFQQLVAAGYRYFVLDLPAPILSAVARLPEANSVLLFNIGSTDDVLRSRQCRQNLLHILPSRAMRADALAQYLLKKRWTRWFLVIGPGEGDRLYAAAIRRAAKRLRIEIVEAKTWEHTYDARRTAQSEIPVFTQGVDYDVLVVADEDSVFGEYLAYRTWTPRLIAGTQGLVPTAWHRTHEQWGAVQLQNRFHDQAGRWMREKDYAAWLAIRALGEAATRSGGVEFDPLKTFLLGENFALAGFKGKPLSFRAWNGQLRQPVLLAAPRSMVAVAPLEGFLHPRNELDTLGYDRAEVDCR